MTPARRQPQGNVAPNNRNSQQPQNQQQTNRQQQVSPASMSRGRREYSGASPAGAGASSAHSGRDQQHYHDDYNARSGRGGRGGGAVTNRGGGRPEKRMETVTSELRNFQKDFHLASDQNRGYYEKQPSPKLASPSGQNQQQQQQARGSPGQKGSSPPTAASEVAAGQRRTSPPTASIITRQDSTEQRTPTPAKSPPMAGGTPAAVATPVQPVSVTPVANTPVSSPANVVSASIASKSKLNPNAKEFVLNPKAKEFVPPGAQVQPRPPVGQTPPPARPITPATPTAGAMSLVPGYYPGAIPYSQAGNFPFLGSVPGGTVGGASTYIYAPTSQPPPPQYQQQPRFRAAAPVTSAREATSQVIAGEYSTKYFTMIFFDSIIHSE